MNKSIVKRIAKNSKITWHPMTKKLHKVYINSYDEDYLERIIANFKEKQSLNPQIIYVTSNRAEIKENNTQKSKSEKLNIDYKIIAGVFNPWFDTEVFNNGEMLTVIELTVGSDQSKKSFHEELRTLIMLDFLKSISQANVSAMGSNFFVLRELINSDLELSEVYKKLMGQKIGAEQFAHYFGRQRDFVYKTNIPNNEL